MIERPEDSPGSIMAPVSRRNLLLRLGGGLAVASALPAALQRPAWAQESDGDEDEGDGSLILPGETRPRTLHTMTSLGGGSFLVAGGVQNSASPLASAEIYTPGGGWRDVASMNVARGQHAATKLPGNRVLVLGGYGLGPLGSTEIYDVDNDTWTVGPDLATPRFQHTAVKESGKIYLFGGYYLSPLSSVEVLTVRSFRA